MKRVAIVILNWNGRNFLEQFLPAVVKFSPDFSEIILADNASTDNSVDFVKKNYPVVTTIQNKTNGGYAKGYNDALANLDHEYFILLNSDVEVTQGWVEPVIEMMDADKNVSACQPKVLSYHNKKQFEYAGAAGGFIDKYGFPFCRGRIFNSFEDDNAQYNNEKEIFWATGACLFIRSEIFRKAGGLDEDFFAHMEEIDLCWRMKNMGHKIMYSPRSSVFHVGGGTLSKINPQKTFLNFRNNLLLVCKNHASKFFGLKVFIRMCFDGIACLKFFFSGNFAHAWAVQRAHYNFYCVLGKTLRKRSDIRKKITKYSTSAIYRKSIVFEYFLRGKKKFSELDQIKF